MQNCDHSCVVITAGEIVVEMAAKVHSKVTCIAFHKVW